MVVDVVASNTALNQSSASGGDVDSAERGSLEHTRTSDLEPFSSDSHGVFEYNLGRVSSDSVENGGGERSTSQVQLGVKSSEVHGLVSSVGVEEAHPVRVNDRLVLGNNRSALNEVISLVHGSGEVDLLSGGASRQIERKFNVDDRQVHQSGLGHAGDSSVSQTVSLTETGELGESGSDGEDSQKLSEDSSFVLNVVQIGRVEESPVLLVDNSEETGDSVVLSVAGRVVSTLSQVEDSLVELDLALVSLDDVVDR